MQLGKEEKKEGNEGQEGVEEEKEFVVRGLGLGQKEKGEEVQGRQGEKWNAWAESEAWTEGARGKGEGSEKENHQWREQGKFGGDCPTNLHDTYTPQKIQHLRIINSVHI